LDLLTMVQCFCLNAWMHTQMWPDFVKSIPLSCLISEILMAETKHQTKVFVFLMNWGGVWVLLIWVLLVAFILFIQHTSIHFNGFCDKWTVGYNYCIYCCFFNCIHCLLPIIMTILSWSWDEATQIYLKLSLLNFFAIELPS